MAYKTHKLNPLSIEFGQCLDGHYINEWCKDQIENEGSHIKEAKRLLSKGYKDDKTYIKARGEWNEICFMRADKKTVVPVRCHECKHRPCYTKIGKTWCLHGPGYNEETMEEDKTCPFLCSDSFYNRRPADSFYCAYGERGNSDEQTCPRD